MRTTLTIDDDLAVQIEALRRKGGRRFREVVNEALRRGLSAMESPRKSQRSFKTRVFDAGAARLPNLDNVAEVLAVIEGEEFK
jgi:hypothetical protein